MPKKLQLYLNAEENALLDRIAKRDNRSRSDVVRWLLEGYESGQLRPDYRLGIIAAMKTLVDLGLLTKERMAEEMNQFEVNPDYLQKLYFAALVGLEDQSNLVTGPPLTVRRYPQSVRGEKAQEKARKVASNG